MTRGTFTLVLSLAAVALPQCDASTQTGHSPVTQGAPSAAPAKPDGPRALEQLDERAPVPLLPMMANHQRRNMRDHLVAVQEIIAGASAGDFPAVERASRRIGYSDQMGQMCNHMGLGAPGFTERALDFHHTADTITAAAQRHDGAGVLQALSATLTACTSCHAAFRQQVVDEATWSKLAGGVGSPARP